TCPPRRHLGHLETKHPGPPRADPQPSEQPRSNSPISRCHRRVRVLVDLTPDELSDLGGSIGALPSPHTSGCPPGSSPSISSTTPSQRRASLPTECSPTPRP